jgi:hypothetical protein
VNSLSTFLSKKDSENDFLPNHRCPLFTSHRAIGFFDRNRSRLGAPLY